MQEAKRKKNPGMPDGNMKDKKAFYVFLTAFLIVFLDQFTKLIISSRFTLGESVPVIKSIFHLTYIINKGAGFGILQNKQWFFIWFAVIVIGIILYLYDKIPASKYVQLGVGLILGGAIGNLIDRIRLNYVIDFLDFRFWPAFNIADSAVSVGAVILIIWFWKK